MKTLRNFLIILLSILFSSCAKFDYLNYTVSKGDNKFKPIQFITANLSGNKIFTFKFKLGNEWNEGMITTGKSWGLKLPAIGKFDYHDSGANWGVMWDEEIGLTIHARYYVDGELFVFPEIPIQTETWYICWLQTEPLRFWLDGILIGSPDITVSNSWITPIYIGKKDVAVATRNLSLELIML